MCSCLAIDSPAPELKLQTLSEIAQEEGVEWDAHAASQDLLQRPPHTAPGYLNGAHAAISCDCIGRAHSQVHVLGAQPKAAQQRQHSLVQLESFQ